MNKHTLTLHDTIDEGDTLEVFADRCTYVTAQEEGRCATVRLTPSQVETLIAFLTEEA